MEHGLNTDFTNDLTNPCFIRVSSVAKSSSSLRWQGVWRGIDCNFRVVMPVPPRDTLRSQTESGPIHVLPTGAPLRCPTIYKCRHLQAIAMSFWKSDLVVPVTP